MDLGFSRLVPTRAEPAPAPLDYTHLIAGLTAMQAASRTAGVEARLAADTFVGVHPLVALVELLTAGPGWSRATAALDGSFHAETVVRNRSFQP